MRDVHTLVCFEKVYIAAWLSNIRGAIKEVRVGVLNVS